MSSSTLARRYFGLLITFLIASGASTAGVLNTLSADRLSIWGTSFSEASEHLEISKGLGRKCISSMSPRLECISGEGPTVLLWGDSLAAHLAPAILSSETPVRMVQMTQGRCAPVLGLALGDRGFEDARLCIKRNEETLAWLESQSEVEYVVEASLWLLTTDNAVVVNTAGLKVLRVETFEHIQETLKTLSSLGLTPILVLATPSPPFDAGDLPPVFGPVALRVVTGF